MLEWCMEMDAHYLKTVHRTDDPLLLNFLTHVRTSQPTRHFLESFYADRHLHRSLDIAVDQGLTLQKRRGHHFMWLCVTNKGAGTINNISLVYEGVTDEDRNHGLPGDDKAGGGTMFINTGLWIRLTQNLDKTRGFTYLKKNVVSGIRAQLFLSCSSIYFSYIACIFRWGPAKFLHVAVCNKRALTTFLSTRKDLSTARWHR